MANQTSLGWKRDQTASADLNRQAQQVQMVAKETQNEARRLASAIDTLNNDRDRLYTRVTTLEQGLDSVTGAIARQSSLVPVTPAPAAEAQAAPGPAPAPAVAPVATTTQAAASKPEKPASATSAEPSPATVSSVAKDTAKTQGVKADAAKPDLAKPETAKSEAAKADTAGIDIAKVDVAKTSDATPATPLVASKSFMAPPDTAATKLIEPVKPASPVTASPIPEVVASAPANDAEADEETVPRVAVERPSSGSISAPPIRSRACAYCGAGC
jgi:hypothetical protein